MRSGSSNSLPRRLRGGKKSKGKKGKKTRRDFPEKKTTEEICLEIKNSVGTITQQTIDMNPECNFSLDTPDGPRFDDVVNVVDVGDEATGLIFGPAMPTQRFDDFACMDGTLGPNSQTTCAEQTDCLNLTRSYEPYAPCCLKRLTLGYCTCGSSNPTVIFAPNGTKLNECVSALTPEG